MSDHEKCIARINELSALAKKRALTESETSERTELRAAFLKSFRAQFKDQLDHTVVQEEDGSKIPLKQWREDHQ